ncbi:helix-turn-helix domain-containing protein [Hongsoonwoonella zoysiae]
MLHDLCRAAGVGPTWLHRCFRAVYGVSPAAYLRALRLREARSLLLDP